MSEHNQSLPIYLSGVVVKGFGRGGKQLGFPTANLSKDSFEGKLAPNCIGVYYGLTKLAGGSVEPMVMSIGWNPHFQNTEKSVVRSLVTFCNLHKEVHILKKYDQDFYGESIKVLALGFIRDMSSFKCLEALIKAIEDDIRIGKEELAKPGNAKYLSDPFWTM